MKAQNGFVSNGNGSWFWIYFTLGYVLCWVCGGGHDPFHNIYERLSGSQGFLFGVRLFSLCFGDDGRYPTSFHWRLKDMVPMNAVVNQDMVPMDAVVNQDMVPMDAVVYQALKWQFDSLEKTGQEQTLSSWTAQYTRVILFTEQSHLTVGRKETDGQRLLGPLPAKEDILSVWINGNLLVVCIVHWSTEEKSVICTHL